MKEIMFVLIGTQEKERKKFLKEIPSNCYIVGEVPHKTMPLWFNISHLFFLPSRTEGLPLSLLEALACGVPAITSKVGGIPEVMQEGKTGEMISIEDIKTITQKIEDLLYNEKKRTYMSQYGRTHVVKNFDQKIITQKIYTLYSKICETLVKKYTPKLRKYKN
jgi:glycosyltransferase involved in cell wall biosynthesis